MRTCVKIITTTKLAELERAQWESKCCGWRLWYCSWSRILLRLVNHIRQLYFVKRWFCAQCTCVRVRLCVTHGSLSVATDADQLLFDVQIESEKSHSVVDGWTTKWSCLLLHYKHLYCTLGRSNEQIGNICSMLNDDASCRILTVISMRAHSWLINIYAFSHLFFYYFFCSRCCFGALVCCVRLEPRAHDRWINFCCCCRCIVCGV